MIDFLTDVFEWFTTGSHWTDAADADSFVQINITTRVFEHIQISGVTLLIAVLVAAPPAMVLGHRRRAEFISITVANLGRAVPSFAILVLALRFIGRLGFWPTFVALLALAIPPIFTNTYTAFAGVDPDLTEAARGMGFTERQLLSRVKLPLSMPVILAATRVAAVQVVATATLGALVAWGGLGRFIIDGFALRDNVQLFAGAVLVAALAVLTELAFAVAERYLIAAPLRTLEIDEIRTSVAGS